MGRQAGPKAVPEVVRRCSPDPTARTRKMSEAGPSPWGATVKASQAPSGDQAGREAVGKPVLSFASSLPSADAT